MERKAVFVKFQKFILRNSLLLLTKLWIRRNIPSDTNDFVYHRNIVVLYKSTVFNSIHNLLKTRLMPGF